MRTAPSSPTSGTSATAPRPPPLQASHTYKAAGSYKVVLKVTDNAGATGTKEFARLGHAAGGLVRDQFDRSSRTCP